MSPPTTFGVLRSVQSVRPGSTRSGEKARAKSLPATSPDSSSSGTRWSRVVPGNVVDSSTIELPARHHAGQRRAAPSSGPRSGSRLRLSGVGTQTRIASVSCRSTARVVNSIRSSDAGEPLGGDVLDVGAALAQAGDLGGVDVDADHVLPRLREGHRERESDVAQADDADAHAPPRSRSTIAARPALSARAARGRRRPSGGSAPRSWCAAPSRAAPSPCRGRRRAGRPRPGA